jgi:hypothetical protein
MNGGEAVSSAARREARGGRGFVRSTLAVVAAALVQACGDEPQGASSPTGTPSSPVGRPDAPAAEWVVDPREPGPDLPPAGRSLFDFLVTERTAAGAVYRVPFPFTALTGTITERLDRTRSSSPLKQVLIPLNRSLQRHAAEPDFFAYPRAVVAVDAESGDRSGHGGILARDRLFLGYHEKASVIEVISYNEAAGRFEFQVVKDYRAGAAPRVFYANRAVCVVCHQNHAPIFARQVWDETPANPRIGALLGAQSRTYYGIPARHGVDVPYAIDIATDRANELAATQRLWQEGCGAVTGDAAAIQCRAAAFTLALQYRLSGGAHVDHRSRVYRERFAPVLAARAQVRWPHGLSIPDPDIPNRDPLAPGHITANGSAPLTRAGGSARTGRTRTIARLAVEARFDPAVPRAPAEVWSASPANPGGVDRLVVGLAAFLTEPDVTRLDRHLAGAAPRANPRESRFRSSCRLAPRRRAGSIDRLLLQCREPRDTAGGPRGQFAMDGVVYLAATRVTSGALDRITIEHENDLRDLEVVSGRLRGSARAWVLELDVRQRRSRRHARGLDGNAVVGLTVRGTTLDRASPPGAPPLLEGMASLTIVEDFQLVHDAVGRLVGLTATGRSDVFTAAPFRRVTVMAALGAELRMAPLRWCCADAAVMPPAAREALPDADPRADEIVRLFDWYCARCHRSREAFPPGFLSGPADRVRANLAQCAERIAFRLRMWELSPAERPKTPMPPAYALRDLAYPLRESLHRAGLEALTQHATAMVEARSGRAPLPDLLAREYEELQSCAPTEDGSTWTR